ncbi:thiol:disulfide interchange protein DsbG [Novimethylophilus kurashikiensis]|uniref:Thiol:disulfide interchange protein DsbG n=1 Tax=Novimethylophilus kurashikiensis TaxID=1825523 RepID=A0A2R5F8D2_9PROT|nr:thiol:disulfide interchange protein DsbG [Novimethylophilus kurashikiensis]GBG14502.1 thiol:disulfide interchange protein DsbG [Novimethylophilus kurashikiensis]
MLKRTLIATALMSFMGAAMAATALPPFLKSATDAGQLQVIRDFKAAAGMTGWVVKETKGGQATVIYTSADGNYTFSGMLLDKDGHNLTAKYAEDYVPKPDYTPAFKAFSAGGEAAGVTVGSPNAKAEIVVIFDANCGYCKLLHRMTKPAVDAGELRIHYVPVAILGRDSDVKGAGLLAAKDAKADADAIVSGSGAETSSDKALLAKVQNNTKLMTQKFGFNGTPVVMYKVKNGSDETLSVSPGVPSMAEMFKALGISGQLDKLKNDPELAKYLR